MTLATPTLSSPVVGAFTDAAAAARNREQPAAPRRAVRSGASKRLRAYSEDQVQRLIRRYADTLGLDPDLPLAIARCESQFQWDAANRGSTARGVFQFVARTWARTLEGRRGTSALDAEANIRMALRHMATIGTSPWNASRACWGASVPDVVASGTSVEETSDASTTDN
jgi:soluble lytic murein transglycosylase-like protein